MHKTKTATLTVLLILGLIVTTIPAFITTSTATDGGWTLIYDGRDVKAYPDMKEYVWQKNATMEPHGIYDKIGLHRLVKTGITPRGVVFIALGNYYSSESRYSNPPTDNWTRHENYTQAIYWANRGFDVYSMDERNNFVPDSIKVNETSFMAQWGLDQWVSDTKEAVEKAKEVSAAKKLFMIGIGGGGQTAMNFAAKYWKEDLRGLVLLDAEMYLLLQQGAPVAVKAGNETNTYNLTKALNDMTAAGNWSRSLSSLDVKTYARYALENPGGPAVIGGVPLTPSVNPLTNKTWANITEHAMFLLGQQRSTSNILGGYGNLTLGLEWMATATKLAPWRMSIETMAMKDWVNCPYLTYDYDDHWSEINVPLLAVCAGLYSNATGKFQFVNGINNTDFTGIMLPNYGHLDVSFTGTYTARDVSEPVFQWMMSQLVGLKATAFCNVTVMPGWTWYFFAHSIGGTGTHTYQWYEGTTLLQGQTSMVLPVTKNTPGTYTFYCKVTDIEGTTTNSNTVTLTVR